MAGDGTQNEVGEFYEEVLVLWERVWGDHLHHGFYKPDVLLSVADHRAAQISTIEEALRFANISDDPVKRPKKIVDVGCGIGGSSKYLSKKYGAQCQGITLSPAQAQRAQALAVTEGLGDKVSFQVADALEQPFPNGQFDLVWCLEIGEHISDRAKFVGELARVAAPGATIIIMSWCHRDTTGNPLRQDEIDFLNKICDGFDLPPSCSTLDYVKLAQSFSLVDIKTADWSENVTPHWLAVIQSAFSVEALTSVLQSTKTIKGVQVMPLLIDGFNKKLVEFSIITCSKPE